MPGRATPPIPPPAPVGLEALAQFPEADLIILPPVPPDARRILPRSALWQALPNVAAGRIFTLAPMNPFGACPPPPLRAPLPPPPALRATALADLMLTAPLRPARPWPWLGLAALAALLILAVVAAPAARDGRGRDRACPA